MKGNIHEDAEVFYMMVVGEDEKISKLYHQMRTKEWYDKIRVVRMISTDYPGNTYLKIYHKEATKQNMIEELKRLVEVEQVVSLGTIPNHYDVWITENEHNELVKTIKKRFEPYVWERS